jgi:hypothetical protein
LQLTEYHANAFQIYPSNVRVLFNYRTPFLSYRNHSNKASSQGDQMSLLKIARNVAQPLFVEINARPQQWKKVAQKCGLPL